MNSLIKSWETAAKDLGIKIDSQYKIEDNSIEYLLIKEFGNKKGTVVFPIDKMNSINSQKIKNFGFYFSFLGTNYNSYNKKIFIETLNDWGYYGDSSNYPNWYTGKSWSK